MSYPADPLESPWRYDGTWQARVLAMLDLIRLASGGGGGGDLTTVENLLTDIKTELQGILDVNTGLDLSGLSTEATLEAVRVLVASLDAKDFATETTLELVRLLSVDIKANQTNGTQKTQITDGAGVVNTKQLGTQLTNTDVALVTNTVIHGLTTGGGGGYVDVKVTPSGALTVEINDGGGSITVDGTVEITNDAGNPIPVSGTVTANTGLSQPLTDSQLRAADVPVSLTSTTVTNTVAVSAASLPLPTGAATETTLASRLSKSDFEARINTLGQKTMAQSTPVVFPSDQTLTVTATGISTEVEQQLQTAQLNELVALFSSKLRDAAGRLRVSEPTSLGDYKILNNTFDALQLQQVGTGTFTQNQNSTTMTVTSGQYAIIQTKQYHPYLNQKSQDWTITFTGMGAAANVEKSIGYISSNAVAPFNSTLDGMRIFKDVSNNYFLQIWRNGTKIIDIARASWTDKLDGTGASGMNINWDNFNVMGADFLYLGGTAVAFKIMFGRTPVIFHIHAYSNTDSQPIFNSPNKPLRWEIRSTTGAGSMNMICGNVNTEGELKGLGNTITIKGNPSGITAASVGTAYAICGVRKRVAQRDIGAMVDLFEGMASSNDYFEVALLLNPTIAGAVTWADVPNTPFQSFVGVAANVATGGISVGNTYASQNMNNARAVENILTRLNSTITDTMDTLVLCVIPSLGSTNVNATGSMQCRWIT